MRDGQKQKIHVIYREIEREEKGYRDFFNLPNLTIFLWSNLETHLWNKLHER